MISLHRFPRFLAVQRTSYFHLKLHTLQTPMLIGRKIFRWISAMPSTDLNEKQINLGREQGTWMQPSRGFA